MSGIEPKFKVRFMYPITPRLSPHPRFFFRLLGFISCFPVADASAMNYFDRQADNLKTILPNQLQSTFELGARILVQLEKRKLTNLILNLV
jgi:hypothetical protein